MAEADRYRQYRRSINGLVITRYLDLRKAVKGHHGFASSASDQELVSREEFLKWAHNHEDLASLYDSWVKSNYDTRLSPTVRRIDVRFGYELWNLMWVTKSESVAMNNVFRRFGKII